MQFLIRRVVKVGVKNVKSLQENSKSTTVKSILDRG
jgi:hypothetical protein